MTNKAIDNLLEPLLLPALLLLLTWVLLPYQQNLPDSLSGILLYAPYWLVTIACIIGLLYNRGKIILASLLLAIGLYAFNWQASQQTLSTGRLLINFSLVGLIPVNLALLGICSERGAFSYTMLIRTAAILLQMGIVTLFFMQPDIDLLQAANSKLLPLLEQPLFSVPVSLAGTPGIYLADLMATASLIVILAGAYLLKSSISFGLLGATVGYLLGIYLGDRENLLAAYVMAGSLLLCIGILRDSYNMAYRDELTGLPQRRALIEQFLSLGSSYTIAMLDVDHFKKFNDTHGHDIGDQVLQMVAARIGQVKGGGKAYRYGGEEFTIVFPGTSLEDSLPYLELVRKTIQDYAMVIRDTGRPKDPGKEKSSMRQPGSFRKADKKVSVTVSIGAAARMGRGETPEDVLKRADQALYKAKKAGRNKVIS